MANAKRVVLAIEREQDLVQYVLDHHAPPSTLVICSTKAAFLEALRIPIRTEESTADSTDLQHIWQTPTLRLLSTSRTVKLVFCPDITHLRAYLATYRLNVSKRAVEPDTALRLPGAVPILAILNPIELHRPTSAFSAQGLGRTFAVAVEAAHVTGSKLVFAECPAVPEPTLALQDELAEVDHKAPTDPWDEELSILNVTTKRLGAMSVGRTVKARTVAERWCTFEKLPSTEDA